MRSTSMNRETAHVFVRETIRMGILNGILPGGSRLVQSDLAAQLEVSTTPVREALRDLASEGLIKIDPHRGGIVCQLDIDDLKEIYLIREHLEPLALSMAAPNITPEVIAEARELHEAMSEAPDSAAWVELNRKFHMTLCTPCNSPRLLGILQQLQDGSVMAVSSNIQVAGFRRQANIEHGQLVDAVAVGDVDKATSIMLEHINVSVRAMQNPEDAK
jgi:DNA-binding GntR family transcriptional regulator